MLLALISDIHLGFGQGTEREEDPFKAFKEALEKSLGADLIIIGGDMFDGRTPSTEIFTKAVQLLKIPMLKGNGTEILEGIEKDVENKLIKKGVPVIAIHGNHERRVKGLLNPVEGLEKTGFLIFLHCNGVVVGKGNEKIAIQGISGIPDQYFTPVVDQWNPKPVAGCFNIFLTHQSIAPFLFAEHTVPLENLPKGFDLYINGHIHDHQQAECNGKPFIIPGSLFPTQITKEACHSGVCFVEIKDGKVEKVWWENLEFARKMYYKEIVNPKIEDIENFVGEILKEEHKQKPLVRIKLSGEGSIAQKQIIEKYKERVILSFVKAVDEEKLQVKTIAERAESVQRFGRRLLKENLEKNKLDAKTFEEIFDLLADGEGKSVEDVLDSFVKKKICNQ